MSLKENSEPGLDEQIIEEMLEALRGSGLFSPAEIDELRRLAESKQLHRSEAVMRLLKVPKA